MTKGIVWSAVLGSALAFGGCGGDDREPEREREAAYERSTTGGEVETTATRAETTVSVEREEPLAEGSMNAPTPVASVEAETTISDEQLQRQFAAVEGELYREGPVRVQEPSTVQGTVQGDRVQGERGTQAQPGTPEPQQATAPGQPPGTPSGMQGQMTAMAGADLPVGSIVRVERTDGEEQAVVVRIVGVMPETAPPTGTSRRARRAARGATQGAVILLSPAAGQRLGLDARGTAQARISIVQPAEPAGASASTEGPTATATDRTASR